jgi:hypothetical protein
VLGVPPVASTDRPGIACPGREWRFGPGRAVLTAGSDSPVLDRCGPPERESPPPVVPDPFDAVRDDHVDELGAVGGGKTRGVDPLETSCRQRPATPLRVDR